ncbi:MAG: LacI family DNA-binding transcriptional regulator [Jatrophihabitans sp.]
MKGEARLIDVATTAGVSLRTASRVLNGDHRVADTTRDRVSTAMRDLDFQPDMMARSLRAGTDTAIGFVVESIADPFFAALIDTVETEMAREGRSVLVASTHRDHEQEHAVIRRMMQRRVAGLLLAPTGQDSAWLSTVKTPVVLVDRGVRGAVADLIDIDDRQAAFDAVTHLIDHGHRRIAYIGDSSAIPTSAARLRGYHDALRAHGFDVQDDPVASTAATSREAAEAANALIDKAGRTSPDAPTAIFSATTRASLGAIPVLHSRGRTDLAFVGLGDFAMADALVPGVTVIDHSGTRVGHAAAQRLLARLNDGELPVQHIRLSAPLVPRGSGELHP